MIEGNMCRIVKISGFHDESLLIWVKFQDDACKTRPRRPVSTLLYLLPRFVLDTSNFLGVRDIYVHFALVSYEKFLLCMDLQCARIFNQKWFILF